MLYIRLLWIGLTITTLCEGTKPPGYVEKPKPHDPNPPKYDYGYTISDHTGGEQGHLEKRYGEHTEGRFYVEDPKESSSQEVRYSADDWGFHPLVKYSSRTPSGHYSARFALGEQAVKEFKQEQNGAKDTTPVVPLLAGTVLPAGTSTNGFIHHDNKNGVQTLHSMSVHAPVVPVDDSQQQQIVDPSQGVLQLIPVLPTIPQPEVYENVPLTTVLSPVQPKYIQSIPDNANKYYPNIIGIGSESNVELGPRGPPNTNSLEESEKLYVDPQSDLSERDYDDDSNKDNKSPIPEAIISESINAGITGYDSETIDLQNNGGFGSKIVASSKPVFKSRTKIDVSNKKQNKPSVLVVSTTTARPIHSTTSKITYNHNNGHQYTKLIQSTQNLISNEDLLNINSAFETQTQDGKIDESIYFSLPHQQNVVTIKPPQNVFTLQGTLSVEDNSGIKKPSGAGIVAIEHEGRYRNTHGDVFKSPIVVADFDHFNSIAAPTQATIIQNNQILYSTTHSPIESQPSIQYSPVYSHTNQPSSTTILVTPRPVSQKFLAPLNAGLRLGTNNNVENFLGKQNSTSNSDVKEVEDDVIEQENIENNALKTVVELFKSVSLDNVNGIDDSKNTTISQVKQLADNIKTQINSNDIQEYPSALEDSKRIQQTSNQQLYQYGAQQVLIHPAEQQNQLAAEELHQQLEENIEESIKQDSNLYIQRGLEKEQVVLQYPSNQHLIYAQPLVSQHLVYNDNDYKPSQSVTYLQSMQGQEQNKINNENTQSSYSISIQHNDHAQSVSKHAQQGSHTQDSTSAHYEPSHLQSQQYLVYGAPQNVHHVQQNYPVNGYYRQEKQIPVPYISHYQHLKPAPYYVQHHQKPAEVQKYPDVVPQPISIKLPQIVPIEVQPAFVTVDKNIQYQLPLQQVVHQSIPIEVKVPYHTQYVEKPVPLVEKNIPHPIPVPVKYEPGKPFPKQPQYPLTIHIPHLASQAVSYSSHVGQQSYASGQNLYIPHAWNIGYNINPQYSTSYNTNNNNYKQQSQTTKQAEPSKYPPIADSYYRKNLGPYGQSHTYLPQTTYLVSVDHVGQHSQNVNNYHKQNTASKPHNWNIKNVHENGQSYHNNAHGLTSYSSSANTNQHESNVNNNNYNQNYNQPHFRYKKEREAKGLRVEYGFKPPLIPSLEIDMEGRPIKRENP